MATTKIVQAVIDFDKNGVSTGGATIDGKRYSNFPAGLIFGQFGVGTEKHSIAFQAEISDFGSPATLSTYTLFDHRFNKKVSVPSHN
jgi:hypothetical protein